MKENSPYQNALVIALGEIARQTMLPIPPGSVPEGEEPSKNRNSTASISLYSLIICLDKIFNNNKLPSKVRS